MSIRRSTLREELDNIGADTYEDNITDREIAEALIRLAERIEAEGTDAPSGVVGQGGETR